MLQRPESQYNCNMKMLSKKQIGVIAEAINGAADLIRRDGPTPTEAEYQYRVDTAIAALASVIEPLGYERRPHTTPTRGYAVASWRIGFERPAKRAYDWIILDSLRHTCHSDMVADLAADTAVRSSSKLNRTLVG